MLPRPDVESLARTVIDVHGEKVGGLDTALTTLAICLLEIHMRVLELEKGGKVQEQ